MSLLNYIKQIWDTTSYVNPTRLNHIEDGIYAVSDKVDNLDDTEVKHGNTSVNAMLTRKEISKLLIPTGEIRLAGIITQNAGGLYLMICPLPTAPNGLMTFTSSEFRPAGQTAVKETSPSFTYTEGNNIIVSTSNSSFSSFVGKQGLCVANVTYS